MAVYTQNIHSNNTMQLKKMCTEDVIAIFSAFPYSALFVVLCQVTGIAAVVSDSVNKCVLQTPVCGLSFQTIIKSSGHNNFVISTRICLKHIIWLNYTVGSTTSLLIPPAFIEV